MELKTPNNVLIFQHIFLFFLILIAKIQATSHKLTCNSPTHKFTPGSTLVCHCHVDITRSGSSGALWNRIYGPIRQNIGTNNQVDFNFESKRYSLTFEKSDVQSAVYKLEIKDLRLYDGVTIQCLSPISKKLTSQNTYALAVCENINSTFCDCMVRKGWASTKCHDEKLEADKHAESLKRACIVIGVLMALMLVVAVVVTVRMVHRDIKNYVEEKRDERLKKQEVEEEHARNAKTPSQSILKRPPNQETPATNQNITTPNQQTQTARQAANSKDVSFSSVDSNVSYNHDVLENEPVGKASSSPTPPPYTQYQRQAANNHTPDFASFNNFIQNSAAPSQISVAYANNPDENKVVINNPVKNPNNSSIKQTKKQKKAKTPKPDNAQDDDDTQELYKGTEI